MASCFQNERHFISILRDVEYFVGLMSCLIQLLLFAAETGGREGALRFQINVTCHGMEGSTDSLVAPSLDDF